MEGIISQRVTPILKCMVLFLFIFTAKVLTSRPQDSHDSKNEIHQFKSPHYVRTFTKYHHRRPIQKNNVQDANYWPEVKVVGKRSVDIPYSNDFISNYWPVRQISDQSSDVNKKVIKKRSIDASSDSEITNWPDSVIEKRSLDMQEFVHDSDETKMSEFASNTRDMVGSFEKTAISSSKNSYETKNSLSNQAEKHKVKAAIIVTDPPTTMGPSITCLYKIHSVSKSVTPSYEDDANAQLMVENDSYVTGPISETTLPNGDVVQVEQCSNPRPSCYALWHQDDFGNITILGQGCWHSSQMKGLSSCDKCTPVQALLPRSKFCCCTHSFCNADFLSMRTESVTVKAESTMDTSHAPNGYANVFASGAMAAAGLLLTALLLRKFYCRNREKDDLADVEKGDVMGSGPDSLATGLLCVDNLTLIEHIGQGKFGSVWRGSLGSTPVAVKLYSNASAWQREAAIYTLPMIAHENLLRYYGSDTRPTLTEGGGREHLIVLELCPLTLRARLQQRPLSWPEFATIAHGLASALAHLHAATPLKPCVVHRDVNSSNVVLTGRGHARLADLGLAQALHASQRPQDHTRISEAGTLRYLSPEALEGALDLSGARAALCAVDVFALGLVLWEMLWRCSGAHRGATPPYAMPYAHLGLPDSPTLHQMQSLVSRNKARPPLPRGAGPGARALRVAADTCDECWDHDAEARLTAVCVEERMAELKQMLQTHGPVIHDNNLHPHPPDATNTHQEPDKNSNCTTNQTCDVTTPLLYPHPHIGRNACIERNTHTQTHTVELIHKSLKDITVTETPRTQNIEENCISVARNTHRPIPENSMNEIRSYQRPLEYVPNDVSNHDIDRGPKQTNLLNDVKIEKPKWGIKRFFDRYKTHKDTEVKLVPESSLQNGRTQTSVVEKPTNFERPTNLVLSQERTTYNFEPCTLSPPNRTLSPTMMMESDLNRENRVFNFKELPVDDGRSQNQVFAVIVPKTMPAVEMRKPGDSSESITKFKGSMSSQSIFKSGNSESEDSTVKKRLSCDNKIIESNVTNSGRSSRASINLELQYINGQADNYNDSPFDVNSDCSSSEDEHLMLLSENGTKITMQTISKDNDKKIYQNEVLKEASQVTDFGFNKYHNKYTNFDNEFSDPNDKENLVTYSGDNPVYLAALNGEIETDLKYLNPEVETSPKSPKPCLKNLSIKRQRSLEQVSEIFSSSGEINLQNPAGRVKTPGDLPVAVRRARRDRVLQKGKVNECNRLSLYDDRMMFGNSL
ncbi:probable serine/threonine-protein kinase DDB_G0278901 [Amyelois transitella]|uniref:probable serine/threonine-protein kinase DDB_G0278901 n=1 Tax=Amyelois transitella TaxID=680683 RepID=UPI00067DF7E6|nr:probable serine/threonine-protein kinase DDB_G0278901 [Amyelois transitella]